MKKTIVLIVLLVAVGCKRFDPVNGLERHAGGRAFWSFLLPGLGQVQNEEGGKATMLIALEMLNYATYYQQDEADRSNERLLAVMGVLRLWAASDAFDTAQKLNQTKPFSIMYVPGAGAYQPPPAPLQVMLDPISKRVAATLTYRF
jgi:hypothetical protein